MKWFLIETLEEHLNRVDGGLRRVVSDFDRDGTRR